MKRCLQAAVPAFILALLVISCSKTSDAIDLSDWVGDYVYKEEPIEATQGIFRNMTWELTVQMQHDSCKGILELLGDRTYVKALTNISGDSNYVDVVFDKLLDGSPENLIEGEVLFSLVKDSGKVTTIWDRMAPRLDDAAPNEGVCFVFRKKKKPIAKRRRKK